MTKIKSFTKGLLLVTTLTVASFTASANTNSYTNDSFSSVAQTTNYNLVDVIQHTQASQISALSDELSQEISLAVNQSLLDFGFANSDSSITAKVTITDINSSHQEEL